MDVQVLRGDQVSSGLERSSERVFYTSSTQRVAPSLKTGEVQCTIGRE